MPSSRWTAADIPDQTGRTAVVTGANSGIGFHAARELAAHGAHVVLACRDLGRGREAAARIAGSTDVRVLDLADLGSVRAFASDWGERPLDLLINNAGVMAVPQRRTPDGFELQLGTNHLGHFALTGLLLRAQLATEQPRVVTVSSHMHRIGRIDFADLQSERRYRKWGAYGQAKLANLMFALELGRRAAAAGSALRSLAVHPGFAATNLQFQAAQMESSRVGMVLNRVNNTLFAQSDAQGALPTLFAATVPGLPSGSYVGPDGPGEWRGHPHVVAPSRRAQDLETARRLWAVSEELTGVRYDLAPAAVAA